MSGTDKGLSKWQLLLLLCFYLCHLDSVQLYRHGVSVVCRAWCSVPGEGGMRKDHATTPSQAPTSKMVVLNLLGGAGGGFSGSAETAKSLNPKAKQKHAYVCM